MNYNNRYFKLISNSEAGALEANFVFHYKQIGKVLTCQYKGKKIKEGNLLGKVDSSGAIEMVYHQIDKEEVLCSGKCISIPEIVDGVLRLNESWEWLTGKTGKGSSILEEIKPIDSREKLQTDPFSYKVSKDNKILVFRDNKQIKIMKGKEVKSFLKFVENKSEIDIQLKLAKLTGNYKRGNEKQNK